MTIVTWKDGKPHSTNNEAEAKRLVGRALIIDRILKEMGYSEGWNNYAEIVNEMVATDFTKYTDFVKRVQDEANDSSTSTKIEGETDG